MNTGIVPAPLLPSLSPAQRRRRRGLFIGLSTVVMFVLIGSSLGALFLFAHRDTVATAENQIVGHAFFISSGQWNERSSQGNNDELQIEMQHVLDPAPGKSYYAWLLSDKNQSPMVAIPLRAVPVDHGSVHFRYPGDQQYTNLIANTSRLLITEESMKNVSTRPSSDRSTWRYYAELPQQSSTAGQPHPSVLGSLRALLYEGPTLHELGIRGGLNTRFLRNTGKILEWIYSARDSWSRQDTAFIHRQIVRTLDYLDGKEAVQADVPPGTPLLVDPLIPLLDLAPNQGSGSYLTLIDDQLKNLISAPGITPDMHRLALQSEQALISNVQPWLMQMRLLANQLVYMPDAQLLQLSALALLDNMVARANLAFVGRLDPSTDEVQLGVVQIFYNIQRLATYDITVYK